MKPKYAGCQLSGAQGGVPCRACAGRKYAPAYAFPIPPPSLLSMIKHVQPFHGYFMESLSRV